MSYSLPVCVPPRRPGPRASGTSSWFLLDESWSGFWPATRHDLNSFWGACDPEPLPNPAHRIHVMDELSPEQQLEAFFGPRASPAQPIERLGIVVGGSLSEGLTIKLDRSTVIEGLAVGRYVVIRGQTGRRFFSIITDVQLDAINPLIQKAPPDTSDPFTARVYAGTAVFGQLEVSPMLVLDQEGGEPRPVKTVPAHFAPVYQASEEEVALIFGREQDPGFFHIGEPLEMEGTHVALDLERLVERSAGVFGKTGTGKTFLSRMLLAGLIKESVAVNLVFDMHNAVSYTHLTLPTN